MSTAHTSGKRYAIHVVDVFTDKPLAVLISRAPAVSITSEQGTKMGRQSFIHIRLAYPQDGRLPTSIQVGGSVVPTLSDVLAGGW